MRAVMAVGWGHASGLEVDLWPGCAVFDEQNVPGAAVEDVEAALFVPMGRGRSAEFFVLQQFDGQVAEWCLGQVARDVGEVCGQESGLTVLEFEFDGRLAFDFV